MLSEEQLDKTLVGAMWEHAEKCYPSEACGFVVGSGKKAFFMPCNNTSPSPSDQFVIDPNDYARAEDSGEILAIWHSHPNLPTTPSEADRAGCEMWGIPWLISSISKEGNVFAHQGPELVTPSGFQTDYVGRPYIFGTFDCYSLACDFYAREYGIKLKPFHELRIHKWWTTGNDILGENWQEQGFVPVTDGTFQEGDLLGIAMDSSIANHVAIYVTGDIILHHLVNRLSRRETFGPYWLSRVKVHIRHKSKC